jgi:hypothetical protein
MKRYFARGIVLTLIVLIVMTLAPVASAREATPGVTSDVSWVTSCGPDGAVIEAAHTINLPSGYTLIHTWTWSDEWNTDSGQFVDKNKGPDTWRGSWTDTLNVPANGFFGQRWEAYAPDGTRVSDIGYEAHCPEGTVWYRGIGLGPAIPMPTERAEGLVLTNTPVYGMADPATAVEGAVLEAGQHWFAVASATGTDGNLWYKVYIAGGYGWVPASTMELLGPLPG